MKNLRQNSHQRALSSSKVLLPITRLRFSYGQKQPQSLRKIDKLPPDLKDTVDQMLVSGQTYREIVSYLADNGEQLSQAAVSRYASRFLANAQQLRIAQENFRMILTETERYPEIDPAEAI